MYIPYIETWPQVNSRTHWRLVAETNYLRGNHKLYLIFEFLCLILLIQAMSILLLPHNIPDSLKHLSTMVDDIWYYAGDRSTDVSGSYHPRSPFSSAHSFLSPFHQHPDNIRPATAQVTNTPHPECLYPQTSDYIIVYFMIQESTE